MGSAPKIRKLPAKAPEGINRLSEDLRQANRELQQKNRELEDTQKKLLSTREQLLQAQKLEGLGLLAGGIAHDFNNLLSGILGYADMLAPKIKKTDPEAAKKMEIIIRSAQRGSDLTRQLLGLARQGHGDKKRIDLKPVVRETADFLARSIGKGITLKTSLAEDTHPIEADSTQVLQVLMNLGLNARDAMPMGGEMTIEARNIAVDDSNSEQHGNLKPGNYVRVSVTDTGYGIPREIQKKIFDPFFTTKGSGKGSGLGLAVVNGIMQSHGGAVTVRSESGNGSVFHLYFPAMAQPAESAVPPPARAEPKAKPLAGKRILVVDDEEIMRDLARDVLEEAGASLIFAGDGEEALSALESGGKPVDMVLMDVVMPKMDGIRAYMQMHYKDPALKVMSSSGYSENGPISELRQRGGVGFIQKPFKGDDLLEQLEVLMLPDSSRSIH